MAGTNKHTEISTEFQSKKLQIKCLLAMTQAINNNISETDLFIMYENFLRAEMHVNKMALYVQQSKQWTCVSSIGGQSPLAAMVIGILHGYKRAGEVKEEHTEKLRGYDLVVPVYHKQQAIAFVIIDRFYEHLTLQDNVQFLSTITNIVAVAIENKRLFRHQLKQERILKELEIAASVQRDLVPAYLPDGLNFEVDCIYKPHSNVGGDYYDLVELDDSTYLMVLADISGKGIPAALIMSNFQAYIQTLSLSYDGLESLVPLLNYCVYENTQSDRFLSLFIAEYSTRSGILKYVNAGHPSPYLWTAGDALPLTDGTTLLGVLEELPELEVGELHLDGPALLIAYTDGLSEILNERGDYFDEKQIAHFLSEHHNLSAKKFNHTLLEKINAYKGDIILSDDLAVLTAKINPNFSKQTT